jgi:hypothetical protein
MIIFLLVYLIPPIFYIYILFFKYFFDMLLYNLDSYIIFLYIFFDYYLRFSIFISKF